MIGQLEIDRELRLERRCPERRHGPVDLGFEDPLPFMSDHPVTVGAVTRVGALAHGHRHERPVTAEARVDNERGTVELDGQKHVRARSLMTGHEREHSRRVRGGAKAETVERREQERAVLEAIAAAAIDDHLSGNAVEVDADAAAEQHVDVLERNARDVRADQAGERLERRLDRPVESDAREIGVETEGVHRQSIESTP